MMVRDYVTYEPSSTTEKYLSVIFIISCFLF